MSSIVETPLAEENLGLVHLCANRFRNRGIEYDDLYALAIDKRFAPKKVTYKSIYSLELGRLIEA